MNSRAVSSSDFSCVPRRIDGQMLPISPEGHGDEFPRRLLRGFELLELLKIYLPGTQGSHQKCAVCLCTKTPNRIYSPHQMYALAGIKDIDTRITKGPSWLTQTLCQLCQQN